MSDVSEYEDTRWRPALTIFMEEFWVEARPGHRHTPFFWHIIKSIKKTNKARKKFAKEKGEVLEKKLFTAFFIPDEELDHPEAWDYMKMLLEVARKDRRDRSASAE